MVFGIIPPSFRDGENPHRFETPLPISESAFGVSLRLQTHDSLTFNVNPNHSRWEEGVERIQTVMKRPVIIKNKLTKDIETFVVGTESGVGPAWGKDMVEVKTVSGDTVKAALAGLPHNGVYTDSERFHTDWNRYLEEQKEEAKARLQNLAGAKSKGVPLLTHVQ